MDSYIQITAGSAINTRLSVARQLNLLLVGYTRGDSDTNLLAVNCQSLLMGVHCLTKPQMKLSLIVTSFILARRAAPLTKSAAKHRVEKVRKIFVRKVSLSIECAASLSCAPLLLLLVLLLCFFILFAMLPVLTIFVILGALVGVTQNFIGFI